MTSGPTKDVKEFQFKISGQLRIFFQADKLNLENPVKLVAAASKYGLVFVGTPSGFMSILSKSILCNPEIQSKPLTVTSEFPRRIYPLSSQPSHLDVSADNEFLAVAIRIQDIPVLQIYSVPSFGSANVVKKLEMRLSNTAGVKLMDLQWNPGVPNMIGAVMSDGSVVVFEIKDTIFSLNSLPPSTQAKCLCWSPKGKQVVIGSDNGSLTQYKPDLKQVKTFPPPFPSASIISLHWPSSFQFIAAYVNTSIPHDRPAIVVVNVPKGAQVSYVRYDDVCFGSLSKRQEFYFIHQQAWNVIIIGCGDSMELSVLGSEVNAVNWTHWKQDDSTRAELPLTQDKDDVHNLGITLDTSPEQIIQLNDSLSVGPMPVVISLSHDGVLCWFTALNLFRGATAICSPPQPFADQSGLSLFTYPKLMPQSTVQPQLSVQTSPIQPAVQPSPPFSQPAAMFPLSSTPQTAPYQTGNIFSLPATSLGTLSFGQPSLSSAFASSTQPPSLFSTAASPFALPTFLGPKTMPVPQSTTSVTQPSASILQSTVAPVQTSQPPTFPVPNQTISTTPTNQTTMKPLLPTSTSAPSFVGLGQQSSLFPTELGQAKVSENPPSLGGFGLEPGKKEPSKIEVKVVPEPTVTATSQPTAVVKQEEKTDTRELDKAAYTAAIFDELTSFQQEFSQIKQYLGSLKVEVGEEKIKGELNSKLDSYEGFSSELVETTQAQSAEVAALRLSLLDILTWIQLIKTKQQISKNPCIIEMRKAEDMDPISKHWCKQIELKLYSLQHQVKQAMEQIESLKNSGKGGGLYLPTFEAVLQTIITQTKIASAQKTFLSNIEVKLAERVKRFQQRKKKIMQMDLSKDKLMETDSQLSMLAQKLLQTKLESTEDVSCLYRENSKRMIINGVRSKAKLDSSKEHLLREWHKNHKTIYTRVSPRRPSMLSSDFNSPLKPISKLVPDKEPVSFTGDKVESPTAKVVKPVPSTPLSRLDNNKTGHLSRNLFSTPSNDSSFTNTGVAPIGQDIKGLFEGGVTSTPLPVVIKNDQAKPSIHTSSQPTSLSPATSGAQVTVLSPSFGSIKTSSVSFVPVSSGTSQLSTFSAVTSPTEKSVEFQPKPLEQTPNVVSFGASTNTPVFNFGNLTSKENLPSDSTTTSVTVSIPPSIFSKTTSKPVVFGGLNQQNIKPGNEDSSTSSFNFGSLASSLKGSGNILSTSKDTLSTASSTQPFSFSLQTNIGIPTSNATLATSSLTTSSTTVPAFSFNQNSSSALSLAHTTTTVNSITNPLSSLSFGPLSSIPQSTPTAPSTVAPILSTPSPPLSVTTTATAVLTNTTPQSPLVTTASPVTTSLPLVVSVSSNVIPSTPSTTSTQSTSPPFTAVPVSSLNPAVTVSSVFGTATTSAPTSTVAFTTSSSSIFNTPQISFGSPSFKSNSTPVSTFNTSAFGTFTPATSTTSLFGSSAMKFSAVTISSPVFGQTVPTTSSATIFNQMATTSASPFAQSATSTQIQTSPFSQSPPVQSTASSPFGQSATTFTTTTSSFGGTAFGTAPVFSSLSNSTFGGSSTFGTATTTPSVFGTPTTTASSLFNTPMFGQTSQSNSSPFGAVSSQASPFGTTAPATQASPFAASSPPANPFFTQTQSSVFGQSPGSGNFGSSGGSIFGGSSSFGSNTQASQFQSPGGSIFGGGSGGPFSAGGGQSVGQAGFGAPPSFQSPKPSSGGFGSAPVFGSSPSFGGAPTFGSPSSFGSPGKVFGSTSPVSPAAGFGGQSNMFESLANQNTMSFGNLAHGQPQGITPTFGSPQPPPPQQNAPSFGGNAFSSWR